MWLKKLGVASFVAAMVGLAGFYAPAHAQAPDLGSAKTFAVLGATTVTSTGATTITGDLGVSPGTAVTGVSGGSVTQGSIYAGGPVAAQAEADLAVAYSDLAGRAYIPSNNLSNQDLGGMTLAPGVYHFNTSAHLGAPLTLDGQGDSGAVFIFQIGTTLVTGANTAVILQGGARPSNVFWQVGSSTTLGTATAFQGSILAYTSITLTQGASLNGAAMAENGAVTLDTNSVIRPNPWQATDISVGSDNQVHLLWGSAGKQYGLWNVDTSFNPTAYGPSWGPMQGWSAGAISTGGDGLTRMLWTNTDGRAGLWTSDSSFNRTFGPAWGPFPGWTATDIASCTNGLTSMLWTNTDGRAGLWMVDSSFNPTTGPEWGPFPGWTARSAAIGTDGLTRLLWTNSNGQAGLWTVDSSFNYTTGPEWSAIPGWTATDIGVDSSGITNILWTNSDGHFGLWKVDSSFNVTGGPSWGPYSGWTAKRVAAGGSDGTVKILLVNQDGHMGYWSVDSGFNATGGPAYGPY